MKKNSDPSPEVSLGRKSRRSTEVLADAKVKALKMMEDGMGPREKGRALNVYENLVSKWRITAGHAPLLLSIEQARATQVRE